MEADYQSLFKWRMGQNFPDQWYLNIDGSTSNEIFTLDQIKELYYKFPESTVLSVMNINQTQLPDAEWYTYCGESEETMKSGIVKLAWVFAFLIPIVGIIMAATFYSHRDRKKAATNILVTSIFMQLLLIVGAVILENL